MQQQQKQTLQAARHREALRRQFIITANALGQSAGVRILFGGTPSTNGSSITLPVPPDDWTEKEQTNFLGSLAHECGHMRFTTFTIGHSATPFEHAIDNALEDCRIEREMGKIYRGVERIFRDSSTDDIAKIHEQVEQISQMTLAEKLAALPALIVTYLIALTEGTILLRPDHRAVAQEALPILEETLGTDVARKIGEIALEVEHATCTRDVAELRKRIIKEIQKAIPQSQSSNSNSQKQRKSKSSQSQSQDQQQQSEPAGQSDGQSDQQQSESGESSSSSKSSKNKEQDKGKSGKSKKSKSSDKDESDEQDDGEQAGQNADQDGEGDESKQGQNESEESDADGKQSKGASRSEDSEDEDDQTEDSGKGAGNGEDGDEESDEGTENGSDEDSDSEGEDGTENGTDGDADGSEQGNSESNESEGSQGGGTGNGFSPGDILNALQQKSEDQCRSELEVSLEKMMPKGQSEKKTPLLDLTDSVRGNVKMPLVGQNRISEAKRDASALTQALSGVLRGKARVGTYLSTAGRHIDANRIARIACGNTRVFMHREEARKESAAVHILLDLSGSMAGQAALNAIKACVGMCAALEKFPEVTSGFSVFPGEATRDSAVEQFDCVTVKGHNEQLSSRAVIGRIGALSAGGWTPLGAAVMHGRLRLLTSPNPKKVLFIITDGCVSDSEWETADQMLLEGYKVFGLFIGLGQRVVDQAKAHLTDGLPIANTLELKRALFEFAKRSL